MSNDDEKHRCRRRSFQLLEDKVILTGFAPLEGSPAPGNDDEGLEKNTSSTGPSSLEIDMCTTVDLKTQENDEIGPKSPKRACSTSSVPSAGPSPRARITYSCPTLADTADETIDTSKDVAVASVEITALVPKVVTPEPVLMCPRQIYLEAFRKLSLELLPSNPHPKLPRNPGLALMGIVDMPAAIATRDSVPSSVKQDTAAEDNSISCMTEVWSHNLYEAFADIRKLRKEYNFVAMDTEFPGVYCKLPINYNLPTNHFQYEEVRTNADSLKLIQLGMTLFNKDGQTPPGICTWQFNFKFSLKTDKYATDSINMLIKAGIPFDRLEIDGIDHDEFAYYFTSSGLVLGNYDEQYFPFITFHCGYDFAYLTKILSGKDMPEHEAQYINLVRLYFPKVYDIKYLMQNVEALYGGLQDVANIVGVARRGKRHQAGSDSLLTGEVFFKINQVFYGGNMDMDIFNGCLYGFGTSYYEVDMELKLLEEKAKEEEENRIAEMNQYWAPYPFIVPADVLYSYPMANTSPFGLPYIHTQASGDSVYSESLGLVPHFELPDYQFIYPPLPLSPPNLTNLHPTGFQNTGSESRQKVKKDRKHKKK